MCMASEVPRCLRNPYCVLVSELSKTQRRLFGLGVFSIVNVIPDLSDSSSNVIPVHISIAPSKYQQLKTGAGLLFEGGKHMASSHELFQLVQERVWNTVSDQLPSPPNKLSITQKTLEKLITQLEPRYTYSWNARCTPPV